MYSFQENQVALLTFLEMFSLIGATHLKFLVNSNLSTDRYQVIVADGMIVSAFDNGAELDIDEFAVMAGLV